MRKHIFPLCMIVAFFLIGCSNQDLPINEKQGEERSTKTSLLDEAKKRLPEVKRIMSHASTRSNDEDLEIAAYVLT